MPVAVLLLTKMNEDKKINKNEAFHSDSHSAIECEKGSNDVECFSFRRYQNIFLTS